MVDQSNTPSTNLNVLVAEDNEVNRMIVEGLLEKFGISPEFAVNGVEALQKIDASNRPYDLILMDCEMPRMNGYDAALHIRKLESEQKIEPVKIIALTAYMDPEHQEKVLQCGMDHLLTKPISPELFEQALETVGLKI